MVYEENHNNTPQQGRHFSKLLIINYEPRQSRARDNSLQIFAESHVASKAGFIFKGRFYIFLYQLAGRETT